MLGKLFKQILFSLLYKETQNYGGREMQNFSESKNIN